MKPYRFVPILLVVATVAMDTQERIQITQEKVKIPEKTQLQDSERESKQRIEKKAVEIFGATNVVIRLSTSPGDVATGAVVEEEPNKSITINTDPCSEEANCIRFHHPYEKENAGRRECHNGKKYDLVTVTQK